MNEPLPPVTPDPAPPSVPAPGTPPRRASRWRRYALEALVFVGIVFAIQLWQARDVPSGPAPEFVAPLADGSTGGLAAWRAAHPGEVIALYFWADWCPICSAQQGSIEALRQNWRVFTVAMQSGPPPAVAQVLATRGLAWPTAVDSDGRIAASYGLRGVPALVLIGPDGDIRSVAIGYTTEVGMRLRLWWARLAT